MENNQKKLEGKLNPWSKTISLPKTKFPMKANLAQNELKTLDWWEQTQVYRKINETHKKKSKKTFVLHDGPPYANGNLHVGHALNKILKDIIVKFQIFQKNYTPYVPGWDCHGLPIEIIVLKKLQNKKDSGAKDPVIIRKKCREYATEFVKIQAKDQSRFGVFWDNSEIDSIDDSSKKAESFYYTMSSEYEASILKAFQDIYKKNLIYKGKRPVYWCSQTATAHAEAEIEYQDHLSPSIYVAFPVFNNEQEKRYVVIWTTTPWTLPANLGVCFNPKFQYKEYLTPKGKLILAEGLEKVFFEKTDLSFSSSRIVDEEEIKKLNIRHPFLDQESKVLFGDHVTLEVGTGIVHTAPGHGQDDYTLGLKYGLEPYSPVDHRGRYTKDFSLMEGEKVFDANPKIIALLKEKGVLIHSDELIHSYPHSWRSHSPLIMRATPQWFLSIDPIRKNAIKIADEVNWIPNWGKQRISSMLADRPDWCLSRQRHWGVPIPAFICKDCDETLINENTLEKVISLVENHGIEIWFESPPEELLPKGELCSKCGSSSFRKETDILDVWFDSGTSWYAVLNQYNNFAKIDQADLYLEGSDQHRGWFQSSLWVAMAVKGNAPYKNVLTHGYVLDEKGRAMSKSLGNVISPVKDIIPKYGADILRLWVSSEDYRTDNKIGMDIMEQLSDSYRKIRNTFRYILGNLQDQPVQSNHNKIIDPIDLWIMHELSIMTNEITQHYLTYEFHLVYHKVLRFCTVKLSNEYFDMIRDRLYCNNGPNKSIPKELTEERESSINSLALILETLTVLVAPILSFTAEEVNRTISGFGVNERSIFELDWPNLSKFNNPELAKKFNTLMKEKEVLNQQLELMRFRKEIGSSIDADVEVPGSIFEIGFSPKKIAEIFVVSQVKKGEKTQAFVSAQEKCPRCWRHQSLEVSNLCTRCSLVV